MSSTSMTWKQSQARRPPSEFEGSHIPVPAEVLSPAISRHTGGWPRSTLSLIHDVRIYERAVKPYGDIAVQPLAH